MQEDCLQTQTVTLDDVKRLLKKNSSPFSFFFSSFPFVVWTFSLKSFFFFLYKQSLASGNYEFLFLPYKILLTDNNNTRFTVALYSALFSGKSRCFFLACLTALNKTLQSWSAFKLRFLFKKKVLRQELKFGYFSALLL